MIIPATSQMGNGLTSINSITHDGKALVFGIDNNGFIHYTVKQDGFEDDYGNTDIKGWTNWKKLELPGIQNDNSFEEEDKSVIDKELEDLKDQNNDEYILRSRYSTFDLTEKAPTQLISGMGYLYVFRQSKSNSDKARATPNTLLVDRFVLDGMTNTLVRKLDVRFKRSRKRYKPQEGKGNNFIIDSLDFTDADGKYFFEPTTELSLINPLSKGWFSVVLLPTEDQDRCMWHIFAYNSRIKKVELFSIGSSRDGLFDVKDDNIKNQKGVIRRTIDLSNEDIGEIADSPVAVKYDVQVSIEGKEGPNLLKLDTKIMLLVPVRSKTNTSLIKTAALSFAAAKDGTLARISETANPPREWRKKSSEVMLPVDTLEKIKAITSDLIPLKGKIIAMEKTQDGQIRITADPAISAKSGDRLRITGTTHYNGQYDAKNANPQNGTFEIEASWIGKEMGNWEVLREDTQEISVNGVTAFEKISLEKAVKVTGTQHGLKSGDKLQIKGSSAFDGNYPILEVANANFAIDAKWPPAEVELTWYRGISFDGISDYLATPALELRANMNSSFGLSFSAWINPDIIQDGEMLVFGHKDELLQLVVRKGKAILKTILNSAMIEDPYQIAINTWHHFEAVLDFDIKKNIASLYLYRNGELVKAIEKVSVANRDLIKSSPSHEFLMGGKPDLGIAGLKFKGKIREVRVWDKAHSPEEIKNFMFLPLTGKEKDLSGYWRMGAMAGRTVADFSIYGKNALAFGDPYASEVTLPRKLGEIDVTKYLNNDYFGVTPGANYTESLEFKVNPSISDAKNVSGGNIFDFDYWGKKSRNSVDVIRESIKLGSIQFEDLKNCWFRASCKFAIPDDVNFIRSFCISALKGSWSSIDLRKHRIVMISDTLTEERYADKVPLTALSGDKTISKDEAWICENPQKPVAMPEIKKDSRGLAVTGGLLDFINPSGRLSALETCEGNVQVSYFDLESNMHLVNFDATDDNFNAVFEQWVPEAKRACLNTTEDGSHVELKKPVEIKNDWTVEAWVHYNNIYRAIFINGSKKFIELPSVGDLGLRGSFTVSIWINFKEEDKKERAVLGTEKESGTGKLLHLVIRDKKPYMGFYGIDTSGNTILDANKWYHIAWRYDLAKKEQSIFVNGKLDVKNSGKEPFQGKETNKVYLGKYSGGDNYFINAKFSELRIWNRACSDQEIAEDVERKPEINGLVGYWPLKAIDDGKTPHGFSGKDGIVSECSVVDDCTTPTPGYGKIINVLTESMNKYEYRLAIRDCQLGTLFGSRFYGCGNDNGQLTHGWHHIAAVGREVLDNEDSQASDSGSTANESTKPTIAYYIDGKKAGECRIRCQADINRIGTAGLADKGRNVLTLDKDQVIELSTVKELGLRGSFTVCVWIYLTGDNAEQVVLGTTRTEKSKMLHLVIRNNIPYLGFHTCDTEGKTKLNLNQWYHIAWRYNLSNKEQTVFVNGIFDSQGYDKEPFQGLEGDKVYIGRWRDGSFFKGKIAELRVWNRACCDEEIKADMKRYPYLGEANFTGYWSLDSIEEHSNEKFVHNYAGKNDGKITGLASIAEDGSAQFQGSFGIKSFGKLAEVRIWGTALSDAEIEINSKTLLTGNEPGLLAYYPLTEGSGRIIGGTNPKQGRLLAYDRPAEGSGTEIKDHRLVAEEEKINATAINGISWTWTAPLGQIKEAKKSSELVSVEYSLMGIDPLTNKACAVMRRMLALTCNDGVLMLCDKRIEELELKWIGNAQLEPTLLGFIEGAPPIPSENLTEGENYNGATSVELAVSEERAISWSRESEKGSGFDVSGFAGVDSETFGGIGVATKIEGTHYGFVGGFADLDSFISQSGIAASDRLVTSEKLGLTGSQEIDIRFSEIGRRFIPRNMGYALVISGLADVFITRLKRSKRMISYNIKPVSNIPLDYNTITFVLNPAYTMNGSLDGQTGSKATSDRFFRHVPEMRQQYGSLYPASYYRLLEAYNLKEQINKQDEDRRAYFENFDISFNIYKLLFGSDVNPSGENSTDGSLSGINEKRRQIASMIESAEGRLQAITALDLWQRKMENLLIKAGKRNIVNSYVWDADGGLRVESQEFASTIEHSIGSTKDLAWFIGLEAEFSILKADISLTALATQKLVVTMSKAESKGKGFSLNVDLSGVENRNVMDYNGYPIMPGEKVRRYRFMSFYLEGSNNNFKDFYSHVVDAEWLASNDEGARALRMAKNKPNKTWRILHRVTYVERPAFSGLGGDQGKLPDDGEKSDIEKLTDKISDLEKKNIELSKKVDQILDLVKAIAPK